MTTRLERLLKPWRRPDGQAALSSRLPRVDDNAAVVLPIFPGRHERVTKAFEVFQVRTAHGSLLTAASDAPALAHEPGPPMGREVLLLRSKRVPGIGLLVAPKDLDLYDGSFVGPLLPVLLVEQPGSDRVALRSPIRPLHVCALQLESGSAAGGTDFDRSWIGPWELFGLEQTPARSLRKETEAALADIGGLLEKNLDPSAITAWLGSASSHSRDLAMQILVQLLSRAPGTTLPVRQVQDPGPDPYARFKPSLPESVPVEGPLHPVGTVRPVSGAELDHRLGGSWKINPQGWTAVSGPHCQVEFDLAWRPAYARLRLDMRQSHHSTTMTVAVNGWHLGCNSIGLHKVHGSRVDYWIPKEAMASPSLSFTLDFDPPVPETHAFPYAFELVSCSLEAGPAVAEAAPVADPGELLGWFESLGEDCELGFVQRHFGIEPMGLLRFAGFRGLHGLTRLLECDLEGVGAPGSLSAVDHLAHIDRGPGEEPLRIPEYYMTDDRLEFSFHTWKGPQDAPMEDALRENEQKLVYLRRKFLEDLEDGEKIWVFKDMKRNDPNETFAVYDLLNRKRPNKLFWITRATETRPSGCVEWFGPRLLRGYSGQSEDAPRFDPVLWLELCRNAYRAFAER